MPLGSLRQQLIFPQYEDGQQVVESDAALQKLAAEARLPSAHDSVLCMCCLGFHAWNTLPPCCARITNHSYCHAERAWVLVRTDFLQ